MEKIDVYTNIIPYSNISAKIKLYQDLTNYWYEESCNDLVRLNKRPFQVYLGARCWQYQPYFTYTKYIQVFKPSYSLSFVRLILFSVILYQINDIVSIYSIRKKYEFSIKILFCKGKFSYIELFICFSKSSFIA